jgi:LPXTG-site transpeptidase (sortase) family protein
MDYRKLNHWLVLLGVLVILAGILDAARVVRATPPVTDLLPVPAPNGSGRAEEVQDRDRGGGFLPIQALSESSSDKSALADPRLLAELEGETGNEQFHNSAQLPALPTPPPPEIPRRLWIPAIDLYAPVVPVELELVEINSVEYDQWEAPNERAAGWHASSATLGEAGNTVLNGHHNIYGEVFRDLVELEQGDEVILYSDNYAYRYTIEERVIFPERFAKPEQRVQNAELVMSSDDERLTLVTCWPYESNTHRLVLVAKPIQDGE